MEINVRIMNADDAAGVYRLNQQLGYDYPMEEVYGRILSLLDAGNDILLVVECGSEMIGYAHGSPYETLYSSKLMNAIAFAVDDQHPRELEAAKKLYAELEKRSKQFGYTGIRLVADRYRKKLENFFVENGYISHRDLKHYIKLF
ncbi:MAG: GNAT family N-acetyltransferase [Erysipelotrichaceae bacterium]|jgi:hypothetical protein|nr:GNAT family N-acetyltransferase [Erysipelotrichaceae bacterium]